MLHSNSTRHFGLKRPFLTVYFITFVVALQYNQIASGLIQEIESSLVGFGNSSVNGKLLELVPDDQNIDSPRDVLEPGLDGKIYTPVIFWHGMGDTAYGSINADRLALQKRFPGIKVFSVQIGSSPFEDELASYFSNVNKQIEEICAEILHNVDLRKAGAINMVGFSQGGQFLRGLVERCPLAENGIKVKNLVTISAQHQGVFGLPKCNPLGFCNYIRYMLSTGAYRDYVQEHLIQAEYWHDPKDETEYKAKNIFLPDINNENHINETYKARLLALENLVLVQMLQDEMVVPRESSLFGFYKPGQNNLIITLEESPLYTEDRLGLKQLNESGRLKMISVPGLHLQYTIKWFLEDIADKYLAN